MVGVYLISKYRTFNLQPSTKKKKTEQSNTKKLEKVWIHIHVYLRAPNYDKNCWF